MGEDVRGLPSRLALPRVKRTDVMLHALRNGVRAIRPITGQARTMSTSRVTTMTTRRALARLMRRTLPASSRASLACRTLA